MECIEQIARDDLAKTIDPFYRSMALTPFRRFLGYVDGSLLDVGCGSGLLLRMLKADGVDCTGLDPATPYVNHCNRLGLRVYRWDAEDPLPLNVFGSPDVITLSSVLEHVLHPQKVIRNCMDALPSHGRLVVMVPWMENLEKYRELEKKYPYIHLRSVGEDTLREWFGCYRVTRRRYATPYKPQGRILEKVWRKTRSASWSSDLLVQSGLCKPVNIMLEVHKK